MLRYDMNYKKRNMVIKAHQQYISNNNNNNNVIDITPFDDDDDDDEFEDLIMISDHVVEIKNNYIMNGGDEKKKKVIVLERGLSSSSSSCRMTFLCRTLLLSISIMIICLWITSTTIRSSDHWYNDDNNNDNNTGHIQVAISNINNSSNDYRNDTNESLVVDLLYDNDNISNDNKQQVFLNVNTTKVDTDGEFHTSNETKIVVLTKYNNSSSSSIALDDSIDIKSNNKTNDNGIITSTKQNNESNITTSITETILFDDLNNNVSQDNNNINNLTKSNVKNRYHNNTIILNASYDNIIETVEVIFHDLKYRKVCTSVGIASILCMIIRFPFSVSLQTTDQSIRYPKPVNEHFYKQYKNNIYTIKQNDWLQCNHNNMIVDNNNDSIIIQQCLDSMAIKISNQRNDKQEPIVSMWTRQRSVTTVSKNNEEIIFHGTGHHDAIQNVYQFFGNDHELIVVGASPAPGVTEALHWLFGDGTCHETNVHRPPNYNCDNPILVNNNNKNKPTYRRRRRNRDLIVNENYTNKKKLLPFTSLEEGHINIGIVDYRLLSGNGKHNMPNYTVLQALDNIVIRPDGWNNNNTLRNFSLIVEYPFAHVQSQDMIQNNELYTTIQSHQTILPSYFMEFVSDSGKQHLQSLHGYRFQHLFAFDGLPQFFPTVTSAFTKYLYPIRTEYGIEPINFTYPGWQPDYGTNCRGPLPSNSILRKINTMSRESFLMNHSSSLELNRWYGRTWEFVNLYWWQTKMYFGKHGLDCTHSGGKDGLYGLHKFFIQAMIDDYFENQ